MTQRKLPLEWLQIQLGDVVPYGKTQKGELSDVTNDTWVLELEDVEKESSRIISYKTAKERPFKSTKNRFEKGNVLYGKLRPYLNKVVVADSAGVCTTEIIPLDAEPFVLNRYIFHWLRTRDFLNYVNEVSYGVNMPRLGTKDGEAAPFVLSPLTEQKVIADKLDTLLAQVENTKARLNRIPKIIKRFRQSLLSSAVSGRLTEEWRGAKELIGWKESELGQFVEKPRYGTSAKSQKAGDTPVLRMGNLQDGQLDWTHLVFTSDQEEIKKYRLEPGDILFNRTNSPELVGKTSIFRGEREAIYAGYLIKIKCLPSLNPEFLNYQLNSPKAKDYCKAVKSDGVSQSNINAKKLAAYPLNCPPLEEQTEIVRRVDQLFAHADRIEQRVNSALARVNNLTQSILAKAFRGELTEQWRKDNPELISGENSAEALLERIKTERAAAKPAKKTRKQTTA